MEKEKIAKETPEEIKSAKHQNLMNLIIAETFSRHSKLSDEEFLEAIGFKDSGKTEDEAIRISKYNLLLAITKKFLSIEEKMNFIYGIMKTYLIDENLVEEVPMAELNKEEKGE